MEPLKQRDRLRYWTVALAAAMAAAYALLSLAWEPTNDLPLMLYEGFLVADLGLMPYRDFFEMNPPGTTVLYTGLHLATAGSAIALRLADLALLAVIAMATRSALSRWGGPSGTLAASVFASLYLAIGPEHSLQREYLCVALLALSLAVVFRGEGRVGAAACLLAGFAAGVTAIVKPPLVICWLPLLAFAAAREAGDWREARSWLRPVALFAAGGATPVVAILQWLQAAGALEAYLEIVRNYYPLYTAIDGFGAVQPADFSAAARKYLLKTPLLLLMPLTIAALPTVVAVLAPGRGEWLGARIERPLRREAGILTAVALGALLYLPISGKFWLYHKLPLFYALALLAGVAQSSRLAAVFSSRRWARPAIAAALLASLPFSSFANHWQDWSSGKLGEADRRQVLPMADYLRHRDMPEETVLPLDTSIGAVHALYLARRPLYGRFIYDFHFYHHPRRPYILELRRRFLAQFAAGKPDLLLECRGWRAGEVGERRRFPELQEFLAEEYPVVLEAGECRVRRWTRPRPGMSGENRAPAMNLGGAAAH